MKLTWKDCLKIGVSIFVLYLCIHLWPGAVSLAGALLGASAPALLSGGFFPGAVFPVVGFCRKTGFFQ